MQKLILAIFLAICSFQTVNSQPDKTGSAENYLRKSPVSPKKVIRITPLHYFFDFGRDAFGTLLVHFRTAHPDTLIIHLGEKISGEGRIDRKPGGTIRYQCISLPVDPSTAAYTVNLPPDQRNTGPAAVPLPDSIGTIMPFRYCEIESGKGSLRGISLEQLTCHYRFKDRASYFTCSDTVLNQVWDLCKYTIKATSFAGLYVDGDRERIPYEADALINQLSHYAVDNEYSLARRTNVYFMDHPTWPTEWILHTVPLFYQDFLHTGDIGPLAAYYEALKYKTLMQLEREDGLISSASDKLTGEFMEKLGFSNHDQRIRDIVDWPEGERDGYEMKAINTVVNAFYYRNLVLMSEIAGFLNKPEDSAFFYERSVRVRKVIQEKLLDRRTGLFVDGENSQHSSLHANLFPLAFGLVPEGYRDRVISFIKSRGMACSVYGAQYLLEGLYGSGESAYALSLLTSTGERSWWNMIRSGSTITMEAWDMKYKPNSDWNHAWGAAPANIISRCLWGITPAEPGFAKALIVPQMAGLSYSKIRVPTLRGPIEAEYRSGKSGKILYIIKIPHDMRVEFRLPPGEKAKVVIKKREE
jgi:hypothetical protein